MFVPNSKADYRALIGDKDIDETSDLSEYSSTYSDNDDEVEADLVLTIKNTFADEDNACSIECNGAQSTSDALAAGKSISRKEDKSFNVGAENTTDENFKLNGHYSSSSSLRKEKIPEKTFAFEEDCNEIFQEDQRDRECGEHNTLVPRRHAKVIHNDANISCAADVSAAVEKEKTDG